MPEMSALLDLAQLTQDDYGKHRWTDMTSDLQRHIALPKIWQKKKVRAEPGLNIRFNIMSKLSGASRNTEFYDVDQLAMVNVMAQGTVGWSKLTTNYIFDEDEIDFNRGTAQLVDLMKVRRADMHLDFAKLMEEQFWNKPASPADKNKTLGLYYWLTWNSPTTGGFTSGDPVGFPSGAANVLSATEARWQNWENIYSKVSKDDLIEKMREAVYRTDFQPPIDLPQYSAGQATGIYTVYTVLRKFERALEKQNDSLGNDLASKDGQTLFRRIPVEAVPYLDASMASQEPIFGIDWADFQPMFRTGRFMKEKKPAVAPNSHSTVVVHMDTTLQYIARDRRRHWRIQKAA